jgi:hypothetical protein
MRDEKHRADVFGTVRSVSLGNPAAFAQAIVTGEELGSDASNQDFELNVPAVLCSYSKP